MYLNLFNTFVSPIWQTGIMKVNKNYYCVIMAGGIGARFWPMSRTSHPKQFIDVLGSGETLIQQTFNRLTRLCPPENILIVTNGIYKDLVMEQLPDITEEQVLCEPMRRNTAPCIAYANYKILKKNPDACVVVAPSDHIILKEEEFANTLLSALNAAEENDWLLTLGINPFRPDTGYGYIQYNEGEVYDNDKLIRKVKTFTEKPNLELAQTFFDSGDFLWNSGIFVWSLKSIMKSFSENLPEVDELFSKGMDAYNTPEEDAFINKTYPVCKNISIDYGVMEKAKNVYVRISDFGWSDLGTWSSLHENRSKDEKDNAISGNNVMTYNTKDCIIHMPKDKLVVVNGLKDFIVVEEEGTLLICRKSDEQQIRQIVNDVKMEKGDKYV
jgi:mannose-1-phosphate guanylyltransferase